MPQTNYTPILIYASSTTGNTPAAGNLTNSAGGAELAINYFDGRLFYKDASNVVRVLASRGTGTIGGSNTQVQYNNNGELAGSANMTFNGTSLTLAANPTLSGGTANGVLYLNASNVVTSGSVFRFDGANVLLADGTQIRSPDNFSIFDTSSSLQRFNWSTSNTYAARTGGAHIFNIAAGEQMRLNSTGLGIGNSNPGYKLDVVVNQANTTVNALRLINSNNSATPGVALLLETINPNTGATISNNYVGGPFYLALSTRDDFGGTLRERYRIFTNNLGAGVYHQWFRSDGAEAMRLDVSGNLGLGVTPSAWTGIYRAFQFGQAGALWGLTNDQDRIGLSANSYVDVTDNRFEYIGSGFATRYEQNNGEHQWLTAPSGTAGNAITFTQAMTLDASGNLGVGTTSPQAKFNLAGASGVVAQIQDLTGDVNTTASLRLKNTATSSPLVYWDIQSERTFPPAGAGGVNLKFLHAASDGTVSERMRIDAAGYVGIGTNSPGTVLDVRFSSNPIVDNASGNNALRVYTEVAQAANVGGAISLGGFASGASRIGFGQIAGRKENSTSSNFAGYLQFCTTNSGGTMAEVMRLDSSGNLGLGVTPSAWSTGVAFQTRGGALWDNGVNNVYLAQNSFFNGTNWIYRNSFAASSYLQINGAHQWFNAASGTAGNTITFTQAMTLDSNGRLGIGTTSPNSTLQVTNNTGGAYQIRTTSNSTATDARSAVLFVNDTGDAGYVGAHGSNTSVGIGFPNTTVLQGTLSAGVAVIASNASGTIVFHTGGTASINRRALIPAAGGVVIGNAALATNATDGFLYVPTCAGTPTGTPTAQTGTAPIVVDTTNNKLYFYSGGAWRDAGP